MTEDERHERFDDCFEYNDHVRANGPLLPKNLFSLRRPRLTLDWKQRRVTTPDGPYGANQEQVGGI